MIRIGRGIEDIKPTDVELPSKLKEKSQFLRDAKNRKSDKVSFNLTIPNFYAFADHDGDSPKLTIGQLELIAKMPNSNDLLLTVLPLVEIDNEENKFYMEKKSRKLNASNLLTVDDNIIEIIPEKRETRTTKGKPKYAFTYIIRNFAVVKKAFRNQKKKLEFEDSDGEVEHEVEAQDEDVVSPIYLWYPGKVDDKNISVFNTWYNNLKKEFDYDAEKLDRNSSNKCNTTIKVGWQGSRRNGEIMPSPATETWILYDSNTDIESRELAAFNNDNWANRCLSTNIVDLTIVKLLEYKNADILCFDTHFSQFILSDGTASKKIDNFNDPNIEVYFRSKNISEREKASVPLSLRLHHRIMHINRKRDIYFFPIFEFFPKTDVGHYVCAWIDMRAETIYFVDHMSRRSNREGSTEYIFTTGLRNFMSKYFKEIGNFRIKIYCRGADRRRPMEPQAVRKDVEIINISRGCSQTDSNSCALFILGYAASLIINGDFNIIEGVPECNRMRSVFGALLHNYK